jgi:Arm DNA-binding domain
MPKLTETFARKAPYPGAGTAKHWDTELKGLVLFAGKRTKTWYFQKDVGGHTKRILIGRYPTISADAARKTALKLSLEMSRGAGRQVQTGAPLLKDAIEAHLARPRLRSEVHKHGVRGSCTIT